MATEATVTQFKERVRTEPMAKVRRKAVLQFWQKYWLRIQPLVSQVWAHECEQICRHVRGHSK